MNDGTPFDDALVAHFATHPELQKEHAQLWRVLNGQPSPRRTRRVARMEQEARRRMRLKGAVDWPNLNDAGWLRVVQWIIAIVGIIMLL